MAPSGVSGAPTPRYSETGKPKGEYGNARRFRHNRHPALLESVDDRSHRPGDFVEKEGYCVTYVTRTVCLVHHTRALSRDIKSVVKNSPPGRRDGDSKRGRVRETGTATSYRAVRSGAL